MYLANMTFDEQLDILMERLGDYERLLTLRERPDDFHMPASCSCEIPDDMRLFCCHYCLISKDFSGKDSIYCGCKRGQRARNNIFEYNTGGRINADLVHRWYVWMIYQINDNLRLIGDKRQINFIGGVAVLEERP